MLPQSFSNQACDDLIFRQEAAERAARAEQERQQRAEAERQRQEELARQKAEEKRHLRDASVLLELKLRGFAASRPAAAGSLTDEEAPQVAKLQVELCMEGNGEDSGSQSRTSRNYAAVDEALEDAVALAGQR